MLNNSFSVRVCTNPKIYCMNNLKAWIKVRVRKMRDDKKRQNIKVEELKEYTTEHPRMKPKTLSNLFLNLHFYSQTINYFLI